MITEEYCEDLQQIIFVGISCEDVLTKWEVDFLSEFKDRLETYQEKIKISDKQQAVLDRIEKKLKDAGELE